MLKHSEHMKRNGFTLVEVVVVIVIMSLMVTMGYYVFAVVLSSYRTTSEQVGAQENHRLITTYLENDVGHAKVVILGNDPTMSPPTGKKLLYMKTEADGEKVLVEKSSSGEKMVGYPIKDLFIEFEKGTQPDILSVKYFTYENGNEENLFQIDVLLQNTDLTSSSDSGITILFESY